MERINLGSLITNKLSKDKFSISSLLNHISSKVESKLSINNIQQKIKISSGERHKIPWWVEIKTNQPYCIYYFGPFDTVKQARRNRGGYIEDLVEEKAHGITVEIKQCSPDNLTIYQDE